MREKFKNNKALLFAALYIPFILGVLSTYLQYAAGIQVNFQNPIYFGLAVLILVAALQSLNSDARINGYASPSRGLIFVGVVLLPLAQLIYLLRTRKPLRAILLLVLYWITAFLSIFAGSIASLIVFVILSKF